MAATPRENAALVRRFLTDVVAGGDTDAVDGFLAGDVTDDNLVFGRTSGQGPVTALGWRVLAAADIDVVIEDTIATDDQVAVRATVTGTHRESLMDLAPTGQSFEIAYAWFCHIENDQITAIHSLPDGLGLMRQLGAIPNPPANRPLTDPTDS
ncbi:MAG: ester cyclase [Halapricum sp.]